MNSQNQDWSDFECRLREISPRPPQLDLKVLKEHLVAELPSRSLSVSPLAAASKMMVSWSFGAVVGASLMLVMMRGSNAPNDAWNIQDQSAPSVSSTIAVSGELGGIDSKVRSDWPSPFESDASVEWLDSSSNRQLNAGFHLRPNKYASFFGRTGQNALESSGDSSSEYTSSTTAASKESARDGNLPSTSRGALLKELIDRTTSDIY